MTNIGPFPSHSEIPSTRTMGSSFKDILLRHLWRIILFGMQMGGMGGGEMKSPQCYQPWINHFTFHIISLFLDQRTPCLQLLCKNGIILWVISWNKDNGGWGSWKGLVFYTMWNHRLVHLSSGVSTFLPRKRHSPTCISGEVEKIEVSPPPAKYPESDS